MYISFFNKQDKMQKHGRKHVRVPCTMVNLVLVCGAFVLFVFVLCYNHHSSTTPVAGFAVIVVDHYIIFHGLGENIRFFNLGTRRSRWKKIKYKKKVKEINLFIVVVVVSCCCWAGNNWMEPVQLWKGELSSSRKGSRRMWHREIWSIAANRKHYCAKEALSCNVKGRRRYQRIRDTVSKAMQTDKRKEKKNNHMQISFYCHSNKLMILFKSVGFIHLVVKFYFHIAHCAFIMHCIACGVGTLSQRFATCALCFGYSKSYILLWPLYCIYCWPAMPLHEYCTHSGLCRVWCCVLWPHILHIHTSHIHYRTAHWRIWEHVHQLYRTRNEIRSCRTNASFSYTGGLATPRHSLACAWCVVGTICHRIDAKVFTLIVQLRQLCACCAVLCVRWISTGKLLTNFETDTGMGVTRFPVGGNGDRTCTSVHPQFRIDTFWDVCAQITTPVQNLWMSSAELACATVKQQHVDAFDFATVLPADLVFCLGSFNFEIGQSGKMNMNKQKYVFCAHLRTYVFG